MAARAVSAKGTGPTPSLPATDDGPASDDAAAQLPQLVGRHLRRFRNDQALTLRGLSARSGLSIGFLSQLERGLTSISLTTLRDLALTLGRDITEFFDEAPLDPESVDGVVGDVISTGSRPRGRAGTVTTDRYFTLMRSSGEQSRQYVSGERSYRMLSKRAPGLVLEPMLVEIAPGGVLGEMEVHAGEEFAYVIDGELVYVVEGEPHRLRAGDSLHLKSEIPHMLHNDTDQVTVVVSVVTPRLF
jgi:quercetin dioxygenase-like cupin family protein